MVGQSARHLATLMVMMMVGPLDNSLDDLLVDWRVDWKDVMTDHYLVSMSADSLASHTDAYSALQKVD